MKNTVSKAAVRVLALLLFSVAAGFVPSPCRGDEVDVQAESRRLNSTRTGDRFLAAEKLGKAHNREASTALAGRMKAEKDGRVRAKLAESLASRQDATVTRDLEDVLKNDKDAGARYSAAYALGYSRNDAAVAPLIGSFLNEKEDMGIRLQAAGALTRFSPRKEIFQCFMQGLENPAPEIRMQAATSMSLRFEPSQKNDVIRALNRLLTDKEARVRKTAQERLEFLGIKGPNVR